MNTKFIVNQSPQKTLLGNLFHFEFGTFDVFKTVWIWFASWIIEEIISGLHGTGIAPIRSWTMFPAFKNQMVGVCQVMGH